MTIISKETPKFVRTLDRELSKLVDKEFPLKRNYSINGFDFHEIIEPSKFAENSVYSALMNISNGALVINEPNGYRSFPDFKVKFANNFEYLFEVKSYTRSSRGWSAANLNEYTKSIANKDLKYFKTFYIDFNLKKLEDNEALLVRDIKIGKIYNFASGDRISGGNPFIPAKTVGSNLNSFITNTIPSLEHRDWILQSLMK